MTHATISATATATGLAGLSVLSGGVWFMEEV